MQRNKYLDDLGIPIDKYGTNFIPDTDKRNEDWKKERELYGFDSRECWNLDSTFIQWLYSHLMMYFKDAAIDLNYHTFEFDGKEYIQKEAIEFILERLKNNLVYNYTDDKYNLNIDERINKEKEIYKGVYDAIRMWAEIYSACWW